MTTRVAPAATPTDRRRPFQRWADAHADVLILLLLAALLDYATGPAVSAAAFYIFPVGLAGWRSGGRSAALIACIAVVLNATNLWWESGSRLPESGLMVSQALHTIVYTAVAFLTTRLRQERQLLNGQRRQVESLNEQMASEMHAARKLQELLAEPPPEHPAVEIGTFAATARILGGDTLDVALSGDRLAVLIADVSGKGSRAALATAVLLGMLADCPARFTSPARTLQYLNERLVDRLPDEMFVTAFYLVLDLTTGEALWASAGHEPPLLLRSAGYDAQPSSAEITELEGSDSDSSANLPLAILSYVSYEEHRERLGAGDALFCYTDGLPDLRQQTGQRLGMDRVRSLVAESARLSCEDLIATVLQRATGHEKDQLAAAGLEDDVTLLALRLR